jgi:D-glycero-alpha-D-manno-heptose-7-phosphate kinase
VSSAGRSPLLVGSTVRSVAPVRVADVGGWTDTWFGSPGQVCHLAVGPGIEVDAALVMRSAPTAQCRLRAPAVDLDEMWDPGRPETSGHPLLAHAVAAIVEHDPLPDDVGVDVVIRSAVPPGASLGTSASVVVALLGALDALVAGGARSPADVARLAHEVETVRAGREAGVADQWAAAMGGASLLAVGPYPEVRRRALELSGVTRTELAQRLVTVVFGAHDSSAVHAQVIHAMVTCDGMEHHHARQALGTLSSLAVEAADALESGDLDRWAGILTRSVDAQEALHPALVGPRHRAVIDLAHRLGATGWKVNGAGGEGGSLTVVLGDHPTSATMRELAEAVSRLDPTWPVLQLAPAPGLRVSRRGPLTPSPR